MHEAAFCRAALPAPTQVLGLTLLPYSLGHELYLQREGLADGSWATGDGGRLRLAVLICCESFAGAGRLKQDRLLKLKMRLWEWRARKADLGRERMVFEAYRENGSEEFPPSDLPRIRSGPAARPPGSPFLLRLHQFLVTTLHKSEAEAWDYPLGLAKMQWASYWEEQGGLDIYNASDAEHDAFVLKCEAEERAEIQRKGAEVAEAQGGESNQLSVNSGQSPAPIAAQDGTEQMAHGKGGALA
jgi:hypothetical protein